MKWCPIIYFYLLAHSHCNKIRKRGELLSTCHAAVEVQEKHDNIEDHRQIDSPDAVESDNSDYIESDSYDYDEFYDPDADEVDDPGADEVDDQCAEEVDDPDCDEVDNPDYNSDISHNPQTSDIEENCIDYGDDEEDKEDVVYVDLEQSKVPVNQQLQDNQFTSGTVIVSVRELPSEIHRCSAAFIRNDILLTTATCIYGCFPQNLTVRPSPKSLLKNDKSIAVRELISHPNFDENNLDVNNLGLIFLVDPLETATVLQLPFSNLSLEGDAYMFSWGVSDNQKNFYVKQTVSEIISNAKCSVILREYVNSTSFCSGILPIQTGKFDQGVPLTLVNNDKMYIIGISDKEGLGEKVYAKKFMKVSSYVDWITNQIRSETDLDGHYGRHCRQLKKWDHR